MASGASNAGWELGEEYEFEPQRKIRWLSPGTLVRAGFDVAVSGAFGRLADKREMFAAVPQVAKDRQPGRATRKPRPFFDYSERADRDGLWIDYLSDTGDGFEATYTMAWLLAQPSVGVAGLPRNRRTLPGGRLLLLGGDQVYPAPSEEEYHNRFFGPFRAALPQPRGGRSRDLYAIPGNHDWYDGLTAFTRIFCNPGHFAGWYGRQTRSYWALRLPHNWWIWAIDIQLDSYIDNPQIEYFKRVAEDIKQGDRVILLTAKPSWVKPDLEPRSWRNLTFFEQRVIPERARLVLTLTGDLHHYSRYEPHEKGAGPVRLTAGGGGAYMSCTHSLQEETHPRPLLPSSKASSSGRKWGDRIRYDRRATYPTIEDSRPMARGVFKLAVTSPTFCALLGAIYALLAAAALRAIDLDQGGLVADATAGGFLDFLGQAASVATLIVLLVLCVALTAYADFRRPDSGDGEPHTLWGAKAIVGVPHALTHVAAVAAVVYATVEIYPTDAAGALVWITAVPLTFAAGYLGGSFLFALVLYLIHVTRNWRSPESANTVFASQGIVDYKNFLRLHLDKDGRLTVYALGVDRVCRLWRQADGGSTDPLLEPDGEAPRVRLIDDVIAFDRTGKRLR